MTTVYFEHFLDKYMDDDLVYQEFLPFNLSLVFGTQIKSIFFDEIDDKESLSVIKIPKISDDFQCKNFIRVEDKDPKLKNKDQELKHLDYKKSYHEKKIEKNLNCPFVNNFIKRLKF